jgi:hypothetical protein
VSQSNDAHADLAQIAYRADPVAARAVGAVREEADQLVEEYARAQARGPASPAAFPLTT